ncbi:hypothetical protein [Pelagibacterium lentulum]|uniref:Uncharacterized protein n=1 Tax=Pelagibacterium lentulum TaxID=2029865 RepID=A0A916R661_9HYPH|nr:hypothetical protein [Pelagibacterium lentulum]GGA37086.1 hypothetical protein GCM10011499_03050 [Pelagibacterium lentulum]
MNRRKLLALGTGLLGSIATAPVLAAGAGHGMSEAALASRLQALAEGQLRLIAREPILLRAVQSQNRITSGYSSANIARIDGDWRREVYAMETRNLIPAVMETPASLYLKRVAELSDGLYTEFVLMDARGLNVALSDITAAYWHGDKPRWLETYPQGLSGFHIGAEEHNTLTNVIQRQIAITVAEPRSLIPLGALCAGIDLAKL